MKTILLRTQPSTKSHVGLTRSLKSFMTLFLFSILIFTKTFAQFNPSPGTAPVSPPTGNFGIDGGLLQTGESVTGYQARAEVEMF